MTRSILIHVYLLTIPLFMNLASGIPSWDGGWGWQPQLTISSLVPGSTVIEAINEGIDPGTYTPKYLSVPQAKGAIPLL